MLSGMDSSRAPERAAIPQSLTGALGLSIAFMGFVAWDQHRWWILKEDYMFGWLVPVFVAYVIWERRATVAALIAGARTSGGARNWEPVLNVVAGAVLAAGLAIFFLGAFYRAGAGSTQPGSLALAIGLAGVVVGLAYFGAPPGLRTGEGGGVFDSLRARVAALALFPACVWLISAPLVSAFENTVSLFLLRKVVAVVFFVFGMLGYPLVQEGNVLVLPTGNVGIADACSGIRSLTACLFAGSFLAAVFLDRLWKKLALIGAALVLAFATNLLRSLFLTSWAYMHGSEAIEGKVHDLTGLAVLGLTCIGLLLLLPLFNGATWRRWLGASRD
jgi:exosortase/archaeosortase family protein